MSTEEVSRYFTEVYMKKFLALAALFLSVPFAPAALAQEQAGTTIDDATCTIVMFALASQADEKDQASVGAIASYWLGRTEAVEADPAAALRQGGANIDASEFDMDAAIDACSDGYLGALDLLGE